MSTRKPLVLAAYRNRHWERATAIATLTKATIRSLRDFGYTRVRYESPEGVVEAKIEDLR